MLAPGSSLVRSLPTTLMSMQKNRVIISILYLHILSTRLPRRDGMEFARLTGQGK
jgi:hypothetical protein